MTRLRRNVALLLASVLAIAGAGTAYAVQRGPAGRAFYTPPRHLPGSRPGDLIRWRPLTTGARLPSASRNLLVLYRSTALNGRAIAVSGTVAIPKGKPPKHGWPVISWAHGTAGFGDPCAPSLDGPGHHATGDIPYTDTPLDQWARAGNVVAFAPLSHASSLVRAAIGVSVPLPQSAYGGLFIAGMDAVAPQKHLPRKLTSKARALYPDLRRLCLDQIEASSSWGGLPPNQIFKSGGGATLLEHLLDRYSEPGVLRIRVPVRIEQGDSDTTVPKSFTDKVVQQLRARRAHVTYNVYSGATHHGVLAAGWQDATAFAAARLR